MKKKLLAMLMTVAMVMSLLPTAAMAESTDNCTAECSHEAAIGSTHYDTLAEALEAAKEQENISINLLKDATLDITAWQNLAIGGESTKTITVNGNEKTLTFNKKNSDWNHIATNNNAKLILNNMTLNDSGYNNGPWNRYDHNFACDVELNNVTSTKALAFKADATLNEVIINESGDNYAIWIQSNGQTVSIDGLTVASAGRDIKIDNQYVDNAEKVTLSVEDASFSTAKKAAILVKSPAGADITAADVNITDVVADSTNLVWIDEDGAADFGAVTVTGGTVAQEGAESFVASVGSDDAISGYYKTLSDAFTAATPGDEVKILKAGTYTVPTGKDLTITGTVDGVVFEMGNSEPNMGGADVTFNNVTFNWDATTDYKGLQHAGNLVYNNCTINGKVFLYGTSETFNNCTFNQDAADYNVWTYGAANVKFEGCTFNCAGKSVLIYKEGDKATFTANVSVVDCDFIATAAVEGKPGEKDGKAAIEMDSTLIAGINLTIDNKTTATGFSTNTISGSSLWHDKKDQDNVKVYVADIQVWPEISRTVTFDANGGTEDPTTVPVIQGKTIGELPTPAARANYTFNGWYTAASGGTKITADYVVAGDVTLYAQWTYNPPVYDDDDDYTPAPSNPTVDKETTKNEDGSTTVTETKKDGTTVETTTNTDGSSVTTETKTEVKETASTTTTTTTTETVTKDADGNKETVKVTEQVVEKADGTTTTTTTTETKQDNGSTGTTTVDEDGKVEAEVKVTTTAVNEAAKAEEPITLPMPEIEATTDTETAPIVEIDVPASANDIKVEIPVADVNAGTVAIIVHADGTEEIIMNTAVSENGVTIPVSGDVTVKIVDNSQDFEDVDSDDWYSDAADFVSSRGIMNGTDEESFAPNDEANRVMLAVILHSLENDPEHTFDGDFHDVEDHDWFADGVHWAAENGIMSGTGDGGFGADEPVTREQLAVTLFSYANMKGIDTDTGASLNGFVDGHNTSDWAKEAMEWAVHVGLLSGKDGGMLDPTGTATRAEIAQILMAFCNKVMQ